MSKGDGKIIAIKFTEPLLGDVTGNETHFTISGKEYEYVGVVNGELIDTEYEVDKVERYPTPKIWQDDFSGGVMTNTQLTDNGLVLGVE